MVFSSLRAKNGCAVGLLSPSFILPFAIETRIDLETRGWFIGCR